MAQKLYIPPGHPHEGIFKRMAAILEERGLIAESKLKVQCEGFKCEKGAIACCCQRALYSQPMS
jgi:hypothetical protein